MAKDTEKTLIQILNFHNIEINKLYLSNTINICKKDNLKSLVTTKPKDHDFYLYTDDKYLELVNDTKKIVKDYIAHKNFNKFNYLFI